MKTAQQTLATIRAESPQHSDAFDVIALRHSRARTGTGKHKAWCDFVRITATKPLAHLARHEPQRLDTLRDLFSALVGESI